MMLSRRSLVAGTAAMALSGGTAARGTTDRVDVVIAGAGIAGLHAARLLAAEGAKVVVLEAADAVGGRLKTLEHLPGKPEAGGQTIDAMYARVLREIAALDLATMPRIDPVPGDSIAAGGRVMPASAWATSPANRVPGPARALLPGRLYAHFLDAANPVAALDQWQLPEHAGLDAIGVSTLLRRGGADDEALRLIQHSFDGPALSGMSALFACRKRLVQTIGAAAAVRVRGGSQSLPRAMAASLGDAVQIGARVTAIVQDASGVDMRTADGRRFQGRFGLCAVPFPALRRITLDPLPDPAFRRAVATLPYSAIIMVTLVVDRAFWESDGLPPAMYVDGPLQRITSAAGQGGGLPTISCWLRGSSAARVARLRDADISGWVIAELARLRPATKGAVSPGAVTRWNDASAAGGAYHYFAPGQTAPLFSAMRQPWGRVRFAGEHLADLQQGMEGACEAAEREALALLALL
ncbi:MAG: flavin monoamine oxidase family protein [Polymorphobacter sp.]